MQIIHHHERENRTEYVLIDILPPKRMPFLMVNVYYLAFANTTVFLLGKVIICNTLYNGIKQKKVAPLLCSATLDIATYLQIISIFTKKD